MVEPDPEIDALAAAVDAAETERPPEKRQIRRKPARRRPGMAPPAANGGTRPPLVDPPLVSPGVAVPPPHADTVEVKPEELGDGTKEATIIWPRVLKEQRDIGYAPDAIGIRITRKPVGPMKGPEAHLTPIEGGLVSGDSPGEELYNYIVDYYHMGTNSPAVYSLGFFYRAGGGAIRGSAELRLEHPEQIRRQREAAERANRAKWAAAAQGGAPPAGYRPPYTPPYYPQAPQAQTPPPPTATEVELLRQLSQENGYYKGLMEARVSGAPVPAAAPPPPVDPRLPPAGVTAAEWDEIQTARQTKATVKALMQLGIVPAGIQTGAVPLQAPAAVAAPAAPPDPLAGFDMLLRFFERADSFRKKFADVMGIDPSTGQAPPEEKDETLMTPILNAGTEKEIRAGAKLEDEGWLEYLARWAQQNPHLTGKLMKEISSKLDPQSLAKLVERMATAKQQPARIAAAPQRQGAAPAASATATPATPAQAPGWVPTGG